MIRAFFVTFEAFKDLEGFYFITAKAQGTQRFFHQRAPQRNMRLEVWTSLVTQFFMNSNSRAEREKQMLLRKLIICLTFVKQISNPRKSVAFSVQTCLTAVRSAGNNRILRIKTYFLSLSILRYNPSTRSRAQGVLRRNFRLELIEGS